jgi:DNA-binding IclR family transcriptional regulator
VFGHRRVLVGAVGVAGAVERVLTGAEPHPRLVASVRDCARSVSHELGAGRF